MASQPKIVIVNDKMQRRYRYAVTSPIGRDFDLIARLGARLLG
jgi:hypothetical protein